MSAYAGKEESKTEMPAEFQQFIKMGWENLVPLLNIGIGQLSEALVTGGSQATLPIIQRAQESQRSATSKALAEADQRYAQMGQAGTPFAEAERSRITSEGLRSIADIGPQIAMQMIGGMPSFLGGYGGLLQALTGTKTTESEGKRGGGGM